MAIETPEEVLSQIIIYKGKVDEITLEKMD